MKASWIEEDLICVACYTDQEKIVHYINGRCDECGATSWETKEELDKEWQAMIKLSTGEVPDGGKLVEHFSKQESHSVVLDTQMNPVLRMVAAKLQKRGLKKFRRGLMNFGQKKTGF